MRVIASNRANWSPPIAASSTKRKTFPIFGGMDEAKCAHVRLSHSKVCTGMRLLGERRR